MLNSNFIDLPGEMYYYAFHRKSYLQLKYPVGLLVFRVQGIDITLKYMVPRVKYYKFHL